MTTVIFSLVLIDEKPIGIHPAGWLRTAEKHYNTKFMFVNIYFKN